MNDITTQMKDNHCRAIIIDCITQKNVQYENNK